MMVVNLDCLVRILSCDIDSIIFMVHFCTSGNASVTSFEFILTLLLNESFAWCNKNAAQMLNYL